MMKKMKFIFLMIVSVLLLAACSNANDETAESSKEDTSADIEQLVHEYSVGSFENVSASITSSELIVTESNDEETTYALPEDTFFLSIAPYVEQTHPCEIHSLTGCQGEMVQETFAVEILDSKGNIVIDETMETMANGFIDLWLPRNDDYQVKVTHDGKTAEAVLSTYDGDQTCITTMQLTEMNI